MQEDEINSCERECLVYAHVFHFSSLLASKIIWNTKITMCILLLLGTANFEPSPCLPVKSLLRFSFLAPTACAVISGSDEVPVE